MTPQPSTISAATLGAVLAAAGAAKVTAIPQMRDRADHLGYSVTAYRLIGATEIVAVLGLVAGVSRPRLGLSAATGIGVLMLGAVASHRRAGDTIGEAMPAAVMAALAIERSAAFARGAS